MLREGQGYRWRQGVTLFLILLIIFIRVELVHAEEMEFPPSVKVVRDEKALIKDMLRGMKLHKEKFSYYYPGIIRDFKRYQKQSSSYSTFMEKLSKKDGYITGIVSGTCITICGVENKYVTFQFGYLTTRKQEKKIDRKVKKIVKQIGKGSQVQKAKRAHDYLLQHMQYDTRYYSPYEAFVKGRGMCMSYALAYQRLMQAMNIPCIYVKGKNHAWNMVKIGKYWYNVDVTWDDCRKNRYRYFLKSDANFQGHKRPKSKWLSSLRKAKRSYNVN